MPLIGGVDLAEVDPTAYDFVRGPYASERTRVFGRDARRESKRRLGLTHSSAGRTTVTLDYDPQPSSTTSLARFVATNTGGKDANPPKKRGNAPTDADGNPIELHHDGQAPDSPLEEMTRDENRGPGSFSKNHENTGQEPSKIDRGKFNQERKKYWKDQWDNGRWGKK